MRKKSNLTRWIALGLFLIAMLGSFNIEPGMKSREWLTGSAIDNSTVIIVRDDTKDVSSSVGSFIIRAMNSTEAVTLIPMFDIPVESLSVSSAEMLDNVPVVIKTVSSNVLVPGFIASHTDDHIYYIFIIESSHDLSATMRLKVGEWWISGKGLSENDMLLYHYDDGWKAVPLKQVDKIGNESIYGSSSTGLGLFIISGHKGQAVPQAEQPASVTEPQDEEMTETQEEKRIEQPQNIEATEIKEYSIEINWYLILTLAIYLVCLSAVTLLVYKFVALPMKGAIETHEAILHLRNKLRYYERKRLQERMQAERNIEKLAFYIKRHMDHRSKEWIYGSARLKGWTHEMINKAMEMAGVNQRK